MAGLPIYDKTGAQAGEMEAPESLFGREPRLDLVHQLVLRELANQHQGTAHTKTRGEVAGSTRKLYRQKGTGRARVGDRRPPNRTGGGVAMGPRAHSHRQAAPAGMRRGALRAALSARAAAGDVVVVEAVDLSVAKTKALQGLLDSIGLSGRLLLVLAAPSEMVWRCGRNIPRLEITTASDLSAHDVMAAGSLLLEKGAVARLEERLG
jgi:large subunit ribosomal protein L4